ncbi:MAG: histidinol-phosphatase HisJ family protein [bacterium]|nr:histidinol-phosphatase HisJ family protein [bacterium]
MALQLYDQHLHSRHSWDCESDPRENVQSAIEQGLAGLTFTEHFDTHPDEWQRCAYDYEACAATIAALRDEFGDRIFIGHGIEVCYQPDRMDFILDHLATHDYDVILLSVHWAGGFNLHEKDQWQGLDPAVGTRRYLDTVLEAARCCRRLFREHGRRRFDVLGHLDLAKRYTQRFFQTVCVDEQADLIDAILTTCLEANLIPEINTSAMRQGLDESMPGPATVRRYAALGGRMMTLGSDGHLPEAVGAGFDYALGILREAGIAELAVFEGRRRRTVALDD